MSVLLSYVKGYQIVGVLVMEYAVYTSSLFDECKPCVNISNSKLVAMTELKSRW